MLLHFYNLFFATSFSAYGTRIIPPPPNGIFMSILVSSISFRRMGFLRERSILKMAVWSQTDLALVAAHSRNIFTHLYWVSVPWLYF